MPAALGAIMSRARSDSAERRYADAGALVADLQAFLDDGLVSAHDEGVVERLVRLWRKHRTAAMVAAVASVVVVVVAVGAFARTVVERDRARTSAAEAKAALVVADTRLAQSLVGQARQAQAADRGRDAASLATAVLELVDPGPLAIGTATSSEQRLAAAEARGILGALSPRTGGPPPSIEGRTAIADLGCDAVFLPAGSVPAEVVSDRFACRTSSSPQRVAHTVWRRVGSPTVDELAVPLVAAAMAWDAREPVVLVRDLGDALTLVRLTDGHQQPLGRATPVETWLGLDVATGQFVSANRGRVLVGAIGGPQRAAVDACGGGLDNNVLQGALFVDGQLRLLCADGRVETVAPGDTIVRPLWPAPRLTPADRARLDRATIVVVDDADHDAFIIGTLRGELLRYQPSRGHLSLLGDRPDLGVVTHLTHTHPGVVLVSGSTGAPAFLRLATGAFSGDFGRDDRGQVLVTGVDRFVIAGARQLTRFAGAPSSPRVVLLPRGLDSIDVDGEGATAVAAGADGLVARIALADGTVTPIDAGLRMTVKQAVLRNDGSVVTGGVDQRGVVSWPAPLAGRAITANDGHDLAPRVTVRRVGVLVDGTIWGLGYEDGPWWWRDSPPLLVVQDLVGEVERHRASFVDGRTLPGGRGLVGLQGSGTIIAATVDSPAVVQVLGTVARASQVAASVDAAGAVDHVYIAVDHAIEERSPGGALVVRRFELGDDRATDIAIDDDGRFLVAGTGQGEVLVWRLDTGHLWMKAALHTEQVGAIVLHRVPHRDVALAVTTAGWDHRVTGLVIDDERGR